MRCHVNDPRTSQVDTLRPSYDVICTNIDAQIRLAAFALMGIANVTAYEENLAPDIIQAVPRGFDFASFFSFFSSFCFFFVASLFSSFFLFKLATSSSVFCTGLKNPSRRAC